MVAAALMAIIIQSVMPKDALALPVRGLDWFFKHTVLLGSLQFTMGGCLVVAARAYLRGKPWGRVVLRCALAVLALTLTAYAVVWIPGIRDFTAGLPHDSFAPPAVFFPIMAAVTCVSLIVPMIVAVWYLGTPAGRMELTPRPSR